MDSLVATTSPWWSWQKPSVPSSAKRACPGTTFTLDITRIWSQSKIQRHPHKQGRFNPGGVWLIPKVMREIVVKVSALMVRDNGETCETNRFGQMKFHYCSQVVRVGVLRCSSCQFSRMRGLALRPASGTSPRLSQRRALGQDQ